MSIPNNHLTNGKLTIVMPVILILGAGCSDFSRTTLAREVRIEIRNSNFNLYNLVYVCFVVLEVKVVPE